MDTISVKVTYKASQQCQKELILQGLSGKFEQETLITMPKSALAELPISIDELGNASLKLKEIHYKYYDERIVDLEYNSGFDCDCCGKSTDHNYLTTPIFTYGDVTTLLKSNETRLAIVKDKITQDKKQKQLIAEIKAITRQEVEKEFTNKYGNALVQIAQVREIIANKTRVRTSQIQSIIK
jgi:hypothetical protein